MGKFWTISHRLGGPCRMAGSPGLALHPKGEVAWPPPQTHTQGGCEVRRTHARARSDAALRPSPCPRAKWQLGVGAGGSLGDAAPPGRHCSTGSQGFQAAVHPMDRRCRMTELRESDFHWGVHPCPPSSARSFCGLCSFAAFHLPSPSKILPGPRTVLGSNTWTVTHGVHPPPARG